MNNSLVETKYKVAACAAAVAGTLCSSHIALAQQPVLEETIVTAQRRTENLQDVALAITAVSGEELDKMGISDLKSMSEVTPGFSMTQFNAGHPQLYIRGIGSNTDSAGGDQSVIVFLDEVYVGRTVGQDMDLFDIERIEVLRGPQGTLFGKNVVGGAVNIITTKPTEDVVTKLEGTVGDLNLLEFRGLASGPLSETVFGKISFSSRQRDGYVDSEIGKFTDFYQELDQPGLGSFEQGNVNTDSYRAHLRFVPSDKLDINLSGSKSKMDQSGPGRYIRGSEGIWSESEAVLIPNQRDNIRKNLADTSGYSKMDTWGVTGRVDYFAEDVTFTSLSSYRKVDSDILALTFGSTEVINVHLSAGIPGSIIGGDNPYTEDSETITQEFRLSSSGDTRLEWVTGLYYLNEKTKRDERGPLGVFVSDGMNGSIPVIPIGNGGNDMVNETDSYAVFGQATYSLTDRLNLTLGARQTWEKKKAHVIGTPNALRKLRDFDLRLDEDWNKFTPKAALGYQVTDDVFLYASYSEGFKSGGFSGGGPTEDAASNPFDPEEANSYEIGAKTEWWDNRARLNVAAFTTDYSNLQVSQALVPEDAPPDSPGNTITANAADAEISGVELEFTVLPIEGLTLWGSYTYLDTEFTDFIVPPGYRAPDGAGDEDLSGNKLRNAPKNAYNILVRYEFETNNGSDVMLQADFRHKDKMEQDELNLDVTRLPAYDVLDLRASYTMPNDNWTFTAWVKNATDEDYFLHTFETQGSGFAVPSLPRTYGFTVGWKND